MTMPSTAIIGAAETDELGTLPDRSELQLHAEAARNTLEDAKLAPADIDGIACAGQSPIAVAHYLGIEPAWIDGTGVGGASFMFHVRHAAGAIAAGLCSTVLITHGQSGRSRLGPAGGGRGRDSLPGQFETPHGIVGPPTLFPMGVLRYMKETGTTHEQLASVAVAQRRWAARNPRAKYRDEITVDDVFASPMIAYPMHKLECCLVTDGGGALILTSSDRAEEMDLPHPPVHLLGAGEAMETPMVSQMEDVTSSKAFRRSSAAAFAQAGITPDDVDHLMIYDAFAHLPIYGLEDLGFVGRGEAGAFIEEGHTSPGGRLPLNTNGGGLSYTHTGMYGMFALQESVRQLRGTAPAQVDGVEISVAQGVGGMFMSGGTVVLGRERR